MSSFTFRDDQNKMNTENFKALTKDEYSAIQAYLNTFEVELGLEFHPFQIAWYNDQVRKNFHFQLPGDCLAFCIISTPSMFEKAFLPFIRNSYSDNSSDSTLLQDPLDNCIRHCLENIIADDVLSAYNVKIIQDHEVHTNRQPQILVQTAGHVSGAAYFYQKKDVKDSPWPSNKKRFGVSLHPRYGGWFSFRGALILNDVICPHLEQRAPKDSLADRDDLKIELLNRFNDKWEDWSYRDVGKVEERYSDLQRKYFLTKPADRLQFIRDLCTSYS